ncbi:MAG: cyclase family protein [Desulfamplus sp.]|nr:cyclase family protein [Desulfamplus sp.]
MGSKLFLNHCLCAGSPLYGNRGKVEIDHITSIEKGDTANGSVLQFSVHSGTHIDAPYHFDPKGKTLDQYSADFWVCDKPHLIEKTIIPDEVITLESWEKDFEAIPIDADFLIIKSGFEQYRKETPRETSKYIFHNPAISPEVGIWLRQNRNLKMIGFDWISLTGYQHRLMGRETHRAFLSIYPDGFERPIGQEPILPIEDMKLSTLIKTPSRVIVAPLLYENADGSPVTVLAEE